MRVAVFTDNDFTKVNGVTTTLTALLDYAPKGVHPRIYTASGLGSDQPDYLSLASVGVPIPFYREMRMYVPKWRRYLESVRVDQIDVLHLTTPGPLGLTALWIAKETRLPLIGSFHTDLGAYTAILSGSPRLGAWMTDYMRWVYRHCRRVLVPSVCTRDALVHQGLDGDQLAIWSRGVDTDLFKPSRRSLALRRQWRADDDHPVLLYVGRVSREKGLDVFAAMLTRLRTLGIRCRLVVVGDGPMRPLLAEQCPEAIFMGTLGREQAAEAFASADLFVFPSRTDTAGNVVLEAQAAGLPVVVSDRGGPRENMISGITGMICNAVEGRGWANAIARCLSHPEQRLAMAVAARRYAESRRWEIALEPLLEAYRFALTPQAGERVVHAA